MNRLYLPAAVIILILIVIFRFSYRQSQNNLFITDNEGRLLIFHGINVISAAKHDPLRIGGTTREDFHHIADKWGFNAVRLLIFWDGIEPKKGEYDQEYLSRVRERLDWCYEAGLYVILDMHQDLYSIRFSGDGAPEWAIKDDGQPFTQQTPWELNYLQPAVKAAINNFWINENGHQDLQEHYINAMLEALDKLSDHPAVVGIDIYNEPTMATINGVMNFEKKYLTPFLQQAINQIRKKNNDLWIFFEPSALGPNQGFRSKLGKLKDPRRGDSHLVYFPHIYTLDLDINGKYIGWPLLINLWAHNRSREARKFNTPMMIGEFGLNEEKPGALKYLRDVLVMFDRISSGWFYWSYDRGSWGLQDENGNELRKAEILVRPYPRKINGTDPSFSWKAEKRVFSLSFNNKSENDQSHPTEVFIPARTWPNGWKLKNHGIDITYTFDANKNILKIFANHSGFVKIKIHGSR